MLIPNLNFGGAQRVFYTTSLELSKHYRVVECVFNFESGHAFVTGNEIVSLDVGGGNNIILKFFQFLKRIRALRKLKKKLNPAICISHLEGADLINILSQHRESTITWVHGSKKHDENIEGFLGFIRHRLLIPFAYQRADQVVTVSKAIKEELVNYYSVPSHKIETLYNYFDIAAIQVNSAIPIEAKYEPLFSNNKTIMFSGRLVRQKNPENLLKWFTAFNQFNQSNHYKLILVGDGDLRKELLKLCEVLKLKVFNGWANSPPNDQYDVYFLGFQTNPFKFIARSTAFILPSLWEGFPMALGEAMACGIPVISADCPTGPTEMLQDDYTLEVELPCFTDYGLLLPILKENTYKIWNESVSALLNNPEKIATYSMKSRLRANDFSQERNAQHLFKLMNSVLNK